MPKPKRTRKVPEFKISKFKTKICSMGSTNHLVHLTVTKSPDFFKWLGRVLWMAFQIVFDPYVYPQGAKSPQKKIIAKHIDHHGIEESKEGDRVDIFYGRKKVFLIFHGTPEKVHIFKKVLSENTEFVKLKKSRK